MTTKPNRCADIHDLLRDQPRYSFPPPFVVLPLNGIYFIFEKDLKSHVGCERIVRVGSHTGPNNLVRRLWEHITPHGRSSFRWDLGAAVIESSEAPEFDRIPLEVWDQSALTRRKNAAEDGSVKALDRFEVQLSDYMAKRFRFGVIGTKDQVEAIELEKACIAAVAQCDHCKENARPHLRPRNGFLWNNQHTGPKSPKITDQQFGLLRHLAASGLGPK